MFHFIFIFIFISVLLLQESIRTAASQDSASMLVHMLHDAYYSRMGARMVTVVGPHGGEGFLLFGEIRIQILQRALVRP